MTIELTVSIFDLHVSFVQATELEGAEVDIPQAVVDLFQADVFTDTDDGDVDPVAAPADAAIGTDVTDFEAIRVFKRG